MLLGDNRRRGGRTVVDQVPVCWWLDSSWTPLYRRVQLTIFMFSSGLYKISACAGPSRTKLLPKLGSACICKNTRIFGPPGWNIHGNISWYFVRFPVFFELWRHAMGWGIYDHPSFVQLQMSQKNDSCVISGFRRGVNEIFALLGYYAEQIRSYRRFGTTFRSHLEASSNTWTVLKVSERLK